MKTIQPYLFLITLLAVTARLRGGETPTVGADDTRVGDAAPDKNGILVHEVKSPFQAGTTRIRVLPPDRLDRGQRYTVIYVLPVEAEDQTRYGDGLLEVKKLDLHNRDQTIFVATTFSYLPWYADHPTDPAVRQETYLLKVALPYVEKTYPVRTDAGGRLLLGFSKSGWGAFSLLLRHPDLFGKAAAWDAPLMMDHPGPYGSGDVFGTPENVEQYRVSKLLERRAGDLRGGKRLVLLGYGNFRQQHQEAHALMERLKIDHEYEDGPGRKHEWGGGWLAEAVNLLSPPNPTPAASGERAAPARPATRTS